MTTPEPEEPINPVKRIIDAAAASAVEAQHTELGRLRAVLHLDEHAAKAQEHVDAIARRASEIAAIQKECEVDPSDEATILATRPGLGVWFDALHAAAKDLHGQTFGTQSSLTLAIARYQQLTPEDTLIPPGRYPILTPFGPIPPQIWSLFEALANLRAVADIDGAIDRLKVAHAALMERLQAVTV